MASAAVWDKEKATLRKCASMLLFCRRVYMEWFATLSPNQRTERFQQMLDEMEHLAEDLEEMTKGIKSGRPRKF